MVDIVALDPPHVVEHDRAGQALEHRQPVGQALALALQLDVPAEVSDQLRDARHVVERQSRLQQEEAHAAHAAFVQPSDLIPADVRRGDGDAAGAVHPHVPDGAERHLVPRLVVPRLHDHRPLDAEAGQHRLVVFERIVLVLHAGRIGVGVCRAVDMGVGIHRLRRCLELRPDGADGGGDRRVDHVGVPVQSKP